MKRIIFIALAIFSLNGNAEEKTDCYEIAMTQSEINRCAGSKNQEVKELLEKLIQELKAVLPDKPEANLIKSQKAWSTVVENDCKIESWYVEGGTARPMVVAGCYAEHSRHRIKMLAPLLCHPMLSTCEAKVKYEYNL